MAIDVTDYNRLDRIDPKVERLLRHYEDRIQGLENRLRRLEGAENSGFRLGRSTRIDGDISDWSDS